MLQANKALRIENGRHLIFTGPLEREEEATRAMEALGFKRIDDTVPWREAFDDISEAELPGAILAGARYKEGLTQRQLAALTHIPQRHISEMENGKRPIGKANARKLGKVLDISYQLLL